MRHRLLILPVVLMLGLATGCDSAAAPDRLPGAAELVSKSAESLRGLKSVKFSFSINGTVPGFPVRSASGLARTSGRTQGTIDIQDGLQHTEYRFTLAGTTARLRGAAGESITRDVPRRYTPERLLNSPDGIRSLLGKARRLHTETTENLHGTTTFRVTGKLDKATLAEFVPGVWKDAVIKFWIAKNPGHALHRIWVQLPPRQPNAGVVSLQLSLSEHNAVPAPTAERSATESSGRNSESAG